MSEMSRCSCGFTSDQSLRQCPSCGRLISAIADGETIQQYFGEEPSQEEKKAVDLRPGSIFSGRYRIDAVLGRGGMGTVYKVLDLQDKAERALKILHESAAEGDGSERFLREIEILSHINHPAVPRVYAWGGQDSQLYFVAEYIQGRDLKSAIQMQTTWTPEQAAAIVAEIADALAQTHQLKIVHRDVKPQNIMLADDGSVKLLDFGVARAKVSGMHTLTATGMILGTPEYMSPEQFGGKKVDASTDVYSLGVILFEMLTGDLPFSGNKMEVAIRMLTEAVTPPRMIRPEIPVWLDQIAVKCLQRDPKKRYPSAVELVADLKASRLPGKPRMTWLPGGDGILEDPSGTWKWDLVLSSSREKTSWTEGMGLRFESVLYCLQQITPPGESMRRWTYFFCYWPKGEIARHVETYEAPS